jgi:hypothetical protein
MRRIMRLFGLCAGAASMAALAMAMAPVARATETDHQVWLTLNSSAEVGKATVALDLNTRLTEGARRVSQENARFTISLPVSPVVSLGGGYFFGYAELPDVPDIVEHRTFEQAIVRFRGMPKGVVLNARTRIEQRFRRNEGQMGLRGYQQVRLQVPLKGKLSGFTLIEAAYNLNETDWGQHPGLSAVRGAAGVNYPLNGHISVQPGYSAQYVKRWRAEDRLYHALMFNLVVKG